MIACVDCVVLRFREEMKTAKILPLDFGRCERRESKKGTPSKFRAPRHDVIVTVPLLSPTSCKYSEQPMSPKSSEDRLEENLLEPDRSRIWHH